MKIFITGGASGLGKNITEILSEDSNNKIHFTYNKSFESAKAICSRFSNVSSIQCDLSKKDDLDLLIKKINDIDFDVLINNFYDGLFLYKHFHKINPDEFLIDFKKNLIPTIRINQTIIRSFRNKRKGKIITILTSSTDNPPIGTSIYVCNKSYLHQLVKVWETENKNFGIEFLSINPGVMNTNLTSNIDPRFKELMLKKGETFEGNIITTVNSVLTFLE